MFTVTITQDMHRHSLMHNGQISANRKQDKIWGKGTQEMC